MPTFTTRTDRHRRYVGGMFVLDEPDMTVAPCDGCGRDVYTEHAHSVRMANGTTRSLCDDCYELGEPV